MASADRDRDLWGAALLRIDGSDREQIKDSGQLQALKNVCDAAEDQRKLCIDKGWSVYKSKDGKTVKLRRVLEKISDSVDQLTQIIDLGVGFDASSHAAAPWAVVKFLIAGATSNVKLFTDLGDGIEMVSGLIVRYAIIEQLYLYDGIETKQHLQEHITELYCNILTYLAAAKRYFSAGTLGQIGRGLLDSVTKRYQKMKDALSEDEVDKWIQLSAARLQEERDKDARKRQKNMESILGKLDQPMMRMVKQLSAVQDHLDENKRKQVLQWMSTMDYDSHHVSNRKNMLSGTGQWLFTSGEFKRWAKSDKPSILWLNGPPGAGKTSLVSMVIDYLTGGGNARDTCPTAFFYCSRNTAEPERADPDKIMSALLKQLASADLSDPIRLPLSNEYNKRRRGIPADASPRVLNVSDCADLSNELCRDNPAYIVIDALDECDNLRRYELLEALDSIMGKSEEVVKVFVSSRSDIDVALNIQDNELIRVDIDPEKNEKDINRFIKAEVDRLASKKLLLEGRLSPKLRDKTIRELRRGAQGMFRWVVLSLETLRSCKHDADYKTLLGKLPSKLSELYDIIYGEIQRSGANAFQTAVMALTLLQSSERLLSSAELVAAVFDTEEEHEDEEEGDNDDDDTGSNSLSDEVLESDAYSSDGALSAVISGVDVNGDDDGEDGGKSSLRTTESSRSKKEKYTGRDANTYGYTASWVVSICRNLVTIDTKQDVVRFSHPSVREYIATLPEYRLDESHMRLLQRCLTEMARPRFLKAGSVDEQGCAFVNYSMESWTYHYQQIQDTSVELVQAKEPLSQFLFRGLDSAAGLSLEKWVEKYQGVKNYKCFSYRLRCCIQGTTIHLMHLACFLGSKSIFEEVASRGGYDVNAINYTRRTGLSIAASEGHTTIVRRLLELGAKQDIVDLDWRSPLYYAAKYGFLDVAKVLIAAGSISLNSTDRDGNTPLMMSIREKHSELALFLLRTPGIEADHVGPMGNCAMASAASTGNAVIVKEILKTPGVELNRERGYFPTPLAVASNAGKTNVVEVLLEAEGIDVNHQDRHGQTALHIAAERGHVDIIRSLLKKGGIRAVVRNSSGSTPYQIAVERGHAAVADLLKEYNDPEVKLKK